MPAEGMVLHDSLSIDNTATVRDALKLFNKNVTTNAPIIDKHGAIIAFLSVGDVLREFGNGSQPLRWPISIAMFLICCLPRRDRARRTGFGKFLFKR